MKFYTLANAPTSLPDIVCRESRCAKLVPAATFLILFILPFVIALGWGLTICIQSFLLLLGALFTPVILRTFSPSNWTLRIQPNTLLLNFRHYVNIRLDPNDTVVVQIDRQEIASISRTKEQFVRPGLDGDVQGDTIWYLDIHLHGDTPQAASHVARLGQLLSEERQRAAAQQLTWSYIPIRLLDDCVLRVAWSSSPTRLSPSLNGVMKRLDHIAPTGKQRHAVIDTLIPTADPPVIENRIRSLANSGDLIGAAQIAMKHYNCSLTEAHTRISQLTATSAAPQKSQPTDQRA